MTFGYAVRLMAGRLTKMVCASRWIAWDYWVCYLLETLEEKADSLEYGAFLEILHESIALRQQTGQWMVER